MNIFVANLTSETKSEDLQHLFAHYGNVKTVKIIYDKQTGNSKRYGFVEMPDDDQAREAISELNDSEFHSNIISVKESIPSERGGSSQNSSSKQVQSRNRNFANNNNREDFNRSPRRNLRSSDEGNW